MSQDKREFISSEIADELLRSPDGKYYKRILAVYLSLNNFSKSEVCEIFSLKIGTLNGWIREAFEHGIQDLQAKKQSGRPPKLSPEQRMELEDALSRSPLESGYVEPVWKARIVSDFIQKKYGVTLTARACHMLMEKLRYRQTEE